MNTYQQIAAVTGIVATLTGVGLTQNAYEKKIHDAKEIVIDEKIISWGKEYEILVDGKLVATVEGKDFNWWEDEFVLRTVDGKKLMSEKENKRIFEFDRVASFYDSHNNITGYIAEKYWNDILKLDHIFYIYNSEMQPVGKSVNKAITFLDQIEIYDQNGRKDYSIKETFSVFDDVYTVHVWDKKSEIPVEQVILLACIEDAITDAKASESSSDD